MRAYQDKNEFVQLTLGITKMVPSAILYNDEKILDIELFCRGSSCGKKTVLDVVKTFNHRDMYVTTTVYTKLSLSMNGGVFFGPVFLHGNSDRKT